MDMLTHFVAGATSGAFFDEPILGGVIAITPDIVLGIKRRELPNYAYNLTHSVFGISFITFVLSFFINYLLVLTSLFSHILLDLRTHGKQWSPPLLFPFSERHFFSAEEWEFFNISWLKGFIPFLAWEILWAIIICIR